MQQELPTNLPTIKPEPQPDETTRQDSDSLSVGDRNHDQQVFLDEDSDKLENNVPGVTKKIKKRPSLKKKYNNITNELRSELLDAVENKNEKIKHAAKRLNINYSSAKSICQVFKKEGRSEKKTFKKRDSSKDSHEGQLQEEPLKFPLPHEHNNHHPNPEKDPEKELVPEPPEFKDRLSELRDRLLNSKRIGHESANTNEESLKKFLNYNQGQKDGQSNNQDNKQTEKQGRGNQSFHQSNHTNVVNIVGPGIQQQNSNSGMDGRTDGRMDGRMDGMMGKSYPSQNQSFVFVSPNQMGPMLISQPMMPGNYNVLIPQQDKQNNHPQTINIGPSQTINVNQPHNENHMMHGSYNDGHSNMQTSPTYQGQQMPQQVQYYQIHQPNMMMGPYQGVQLVQPVIYVTSQQGNLQNFQQGNLQNFQQSNLQNFQQQPQYVQTQMPYMMGVPQNQISFQPVMINSYDQQGFDNGQKSKLAAMGQIGADGNLYSMNNNHNNHHNNKNNHNNHNQNQNPNNNHSQNHNQNNNQNQNHNNQNNQNHSQNQNHAQNNSQNHNHNHHHNHNQNQNQNHIQNQKQFEKKENGTSVGKDP